MTQAGDRIYGEFGVPAERAAIVFISVSAQDARAFRELVDGRSAHIARVSAKADELS